MMRACWGRLVLVGSRAGVAGLPGQAGYAASKAALQAWAASTAGEVGRHGVTVNVVAPGAVAEPTPTYAPDEEARVLQLIGARRLATPDEVSAVVTFLASAAASYFNGVTLPVDGAARF